MQVFPGLGSADLDPYLDDPTCHLSQVCKPVIFPKMNSDNSSDLTDSQPLSSALAVMVVMVMVVVVGQQFGGFCHSVT